MGVVNMPYYVSVHKAARILRVHFRGSEWGRRSCGSVTTTVKYGNIYVCERQLILYH